MKIRLRLFGIYRDFDAAGQIELEVDDTASVADVRRVLSAHARIHWPDFEDGLAAKSAFASESCLLRDGDAVPSDGQMAVLPPVSGG